MRSLLVLMMFTFALTSDATAQLFQARFVTSGYMWQRQDSVGRTSDHLFGHQSVSLSIASPTISFYTYGQAFTDLAGPVEEETQYRLYNLYLKWSNIYDVGTLSIGRQYVFAGVGTGTMDGGLATLRFLDSRLRVTGYYGTLPPPRSKAELIGDKTNNFMTGGQIYIEPIEIAQLSVSFMNRKIQAEPYSALRRDSLFNPYLVEIKPTASTERYLSGDLNVEYEEIVSAYGRYDYDFDTEAMARMQFFTRIKPLSFLGLTAEYLQREPRVSYNSIFSVFTFNTLKEFEIGAEYALKSTWQFFAKYGSVDYGDGETSNRVTVGANGKYVAVSFTNNVGYAGELSAASANVSYPLWGNQLTPSLMLSYAKYKLSEAAPKLESALSIAGGFVWRPAPIFSFDTQIQWVQNKIYKNDLRLFLRGNVLLSERLNIF